MIVKNKKTGIQYELDEAGWAKLVELHQTKLYTVLDKGSAMTVDTVKINIPQKIVEFQVQRPQTVQPKVAEPTKAEIIVPEVEPEKIIKPKKITIKKQKV